MMFAWLAFILLSLGISWVGPRFIVPTRQRDRRHFDHVDLFGWLFIAGSVGFVAVMVTHALWRLP